MNSLKSKPEGKRSAAYGIKKAKSAEVNFCPTNPSNETEQSLEAIRKALLLDMKKKDNRSDLAHKMYFCTSKKHSTCPQNVCHLIYTIYGASS